MKQLLLVLTALLVLSTAIPHKPAQDGEWGEIARNGGPDREMRLKSLSIDRAPAVATLKCPAGGAPTAHDTSCITADASRESLRF